MNECKLLLRSTEYVICTHCFAYMLQVLKMVIACPETLTRTVNTSFCYVLLLDYRVADCHKIWIE